MAIAKQGFSLYEHLVWVVYTKEGKTPHELEDMRKKHADYDALYNALAAGKFVEADGLAKQYTLNPEIFRKLLPPESMKPIVIAAEKIVAASSKQDKKVVELAKRWVAGQKVVVQKAAVAKSLYDVCPFKANA